MRAMRALQHYRCGRRQTTFITQDAGTTALILRACPEVDALSAGKWHHYGTERRRRVHLRHATPRHEMVAPTGVEPVFQHREADVVEYWYETYGEKEGPSSRWLL